MRNIYRVYQMKSIGIVLFMLLFFPTAMDAQDEAKLNLKVKFSVEKGKLDNALITITRDGQPYRVIDPNKGKYKLDLELNSNFMFAFTKSGYISKNVIIDTHVPNGREAEYFNEFIAEVTLEPQPEDKIVTYTQPVGKIKYSVPSGDFDYDNDYSATAQAQQQKDKERAVPKPKEPAPNPRPTPPSVPKTETPPSKPIPVAVKQPEYKPEPEVKKKEEPKPDPPRKPVTRDREEHIVQKDRVKITTVTVKIDGVEYHYRKEEYSWGGIYFYKDEKNITDSAYAIETE